MGAGACPERSTLMGASTGLAFRIRSRPMAHALQRRVGDGGPHDAHTPTAPATHRARGVRIHADLHADPQRRQQRGRCTQPRGGARSGPDPGPPDPRRVGGHGRSGRDRPPRGPLRAPAGNGPHRVARWVCRHMGPLRAHPGQDGGRGPSDHPTRRRVRRASDRPRWSHAARPPPDALPVPGPDDFGDAAYRTSYRDVSVPLAITRSSRISGSRANTLWESSKSSVAPSTAIAPVVVVTRTPCGSPGSATTGTPHSR
jgi:hypothetical protein